MFFDDLYFLYKVSEKEFSKIEEFIGSYILNFDEIILLNKGYSWYHGLSSLFDTIHVGVVFL